MRDTVQGGLKRYPQSLATPSAAACAALLLASVIASLASCASGVQNQGRETPMRKLIIALAAAIVLPLTATAASTYHVVRRIHQLRFLQDVLDRHGDDVRRLERYHMAPFPLRHRANRGAAKACRQ